MAIRLGQLRPWGLTDRKSRALRSHTGENPHTMDEHDPRWNDQHNWFRDTNQLDDVKTVVHRRFADDRNQAECRYLMRFVEHLRATYRAVSYRELEENVSTKKMERIDDLLSLTQKRDFAGIDVWIDSCAQELPVIVDRWLERDLQSTLRNYWLDPPTVESMPFHASNWVALGYEHPSLIECAAMFASDHPGDVRAAFEAGLRELGSTYTSRDAVVSEVIQEHAQLLIEGSAGLDATIRFVSSLWHFDDYPSSSPSAAQRFWRECYTFGIEPISPDRESLLALAAEVVEDQRRDQVRNVALAEIHQIADETGMDL